MDINIRPFLRFMGQTKSPTGPKNIRLVITNRDDDGVNKRAEHRDYSRYPGGLLREIRKTHR